MSAIASLRNFGFLYCLHRVYQVALHRPIRGLQVFVNCVAGKHGLEVGGASDVFRRGGLIPLYDFVGALDNCNFSSRTIWAKQEIGMTFHYSDDKPAGRQYINDGGDLIEIPDASYEFILSCHMLEHSANPLRALRAWRRVLKPGGSLILLMPHKPMTFDHKRPVTKIAHLIEDFNSETTEEDLTHLPEILGLHDLTRDPAAGSFEEFKTRCERNAEFRGIHHHVFDSALVRTMLESADYSVALLRTAYPNHIIAIAKKPTPAS